MPLYEYKCTTCLYEFEKIRKFSDPEIKVCPSCKKESAKKQISFNSFRLKGSGWFRDGYT